MRVTNLTNASDILDSDAECVVIPVNCVGVMGAGLAKQFAIRYPEYEREYKKLCRQGKMFVQGRPPMHRLGKFLLFPSKQHWRDKSDLERIKSALYALDRHLGYRDEHWLAIPPVGAGLGGLNPSDVRQAILDIVRVEQLDLYRF